MGTDILKLKLSQELTSLNQDPLFLVFLDLHKSYDTVERGCLLITPEGYGAGPHLIGLLAEFWEWKEVVTLKNGYHRPHFQANRDTIQGGLISTTLFNLISKNAVRNWLALMMEDELVSHEGL